MNLRQLDFGTCHWDSSGLDDSNGHVAFDRMGGQQPFRNDRSGENCLAGLAEEQQFAWTSCMRALRPDVTLHIRPKSRQ